MGRLDESGRLRALAELGLGASPDDDMEYYAERVRDRLVVPVSLVSLVHEDRQVFPGQCGLVGPWSVARSTPLSHSFCQHVVTSTEPLVITDARRDPRVAGTLAITDLDVVAYAGTPLTDSAGHVLGSLCAIDRHPREWTAAELDALAELARACSTELRLRLARLDAANERAQAAQAQAQLHAALRRAELLLTAAEDLADAESVVELRERIDHLVAGDLKPTRVELVITQRLDPASTAEDQLDPTPGPDRPTTPGQWAEFDPAGPLLNAQVVRERRLIRHSDLNTDGPVSDGPVSDGLMSDGLMSDGARRHYLDAGLVAVCAAPIVGVSEVFGVLEFAWDRPHTPDPAELAVITGLAGYVAAALQRARYLQGRLAVAWQLQDAMITELPTPRGLSLAARYRPAAAADQVGGDWYDAFPLPRQRGADTLAVVVGDVSGHDIHAATVMGQLRAMLRQACWDGQPDGSPATALTNLDHATGDLALGSYSTAVLAYLHPLDDGSGRWSLTWSTAGHLPPILIRPDGGSEVLADGDHLLGLADHFDTDRTAHHLVLEPGCTLLLYTDGLVERRGLDIDEAVRTVAELAAAPVAGIEELVDRVLGTMTADSPGDDDIVLLAVHITG